MRKIGKRKKVAAIAALLLAGLVLAVGSGSYFCTQSRKETETVSQDTIQVTQMDSAEVTGFTFIAGEETFSFSKEGQEWLCENDQSAKLEQPAIVAMVDAMTDLAAAEEIMAYDGLSEYGLENPQNTIILTTAKGSTALLLGGQNEITSGYYLKGEDDTEIYLVDGVAVDGFFSMLVEIAAEEGQGKTLPYAQ